MTETAPIVRSITVRCDVERAFRVFTELIHTWWPLDTHARAVYDLADRGLKAESCAIEPRQGGRVYEVLSDGGEADWGRVLVWEPPRRLVLDWRPNDRPPERSTEVEVRFSPTDEGTRVELEHRGWERLGEEAAEARRGYVEGWPVTFDRLFGEAADRSVA